MPLPDDVAPRPTARWSLERRLPLMIVVLLGCVVAGLGGAAYREVRGSAIGRTVDHLERTARELSATTSRGAAPRLAALRTLAADPLLLQAVRASDTAAARDALTARLAAARAPTDSAFLGWELWTAAGERRLRSGGGPASVRDSAVLADVRARVGRTHALQRSPLYADGPRVRYWTVLPIRADGRLLGMLAEHRRLVGSARTEQTIRELVGGDVRLLFTSQGSRDWAALGGTPVAAPFAGVRPDGRAARVVGRDGERFIAVQSAIPESPWLITIFQSEASILRRPHEFLRTLLIAGALALAAGTLGAWILSRHVTRPLRQVTGAAAALAGGDYGQRVAVRGDAEMASLVTTFNAMAARLGQAYGELAERNEALHRANEAKARFLAVMSHELRTPLNAIGGYTELMELGLRGPITSEQQADLARIRRNKDRLLSIIQDILAFSRADAGHVSITTRDVAVGQVVADAVDALGPQFAAKGLRLEVAPVPADHVVRGDREKVQQILTNLLTNALRFTKAGGEVAVTTTLLEDRVRVDVRDTGIGIAPERLGEIFEPFVQVDASLTRETGGTGLGLAISRDLATAMGGSISVRSTVGSGSTFTLELPRAGAGAPALGAESVVAGGPLRAASNQ